MFRTARTAVAAIPAADKSVSALTADARYIAVDGINRFICIPKILNLGKASVKDKFVTVAKSKVAHTSKHKIDGATRWWTSEFSLGFIFG